MVSLTSRVITEPSRASLTFRYVSGSFSFRNASSTALLSRLMRASHRSSTSRSERKLPVVLRTWFSTMKYPTISCVIDDKEGMGRGSGIMRSDCAYDTN